MYCSRGRHFQPCPPHQTTSAVLPKSGLLHHGLLGGSVWPYDSGQANFIILNLAVGGSWPGSPNSSTAFPVQMLVDYVRIYTN
jgi:hypothetical protein